MIKEISNKSVGIGGDRLITRRLGSEVANPSMLARYPWPESDPILISQPVRPMDESIQSLIFRAARADRFNRAVFEKQTKGHSPGDTVFQLLTDSKYNFNGTTASREERYWSERVHAAVEAGNPVVIVYPLFCKVLNWAKQMTATGVTAGEESAILFLKQIDERVREYYEPGLHFQITADAILYSNAFSIPAPVAQSYIDQLRGLVTKHGAEDSIKIHDYAALLQPYDIEFVSRYNAYFQALGENAEELIDPATLASIRSSVHACMNTRRLDMGYADHRALFGPEPDTSNPYFQLVADMASVGFRDLLATKMASTDMNIPEDIWPGHIRVSCHKGTKDGRTGIALRMFPSFYKSSKLLPYQGMPLIKAGDDGDPKLRIDPEIVLRGRPDLVRVVNDANEAYAYIQGDLLQK